MRATLSGVAFCIEIIRASSFSNERGSFRGDIKWSICGGATGQIVQRKTSLSQSRVATPGGLGEPARMGSAASQARLAGLHGPHVRFPPVINTIHSSCWESRRRWLVTVRRCGSNGNGLAVDPEGIRDAIHWCRRAPLDWCCSPRIC